MRLYVPVDETIVFMLLLLLFAISLQRVDIPVCGGTLPFVYTSCVFVAFACMDRVAFIRHIFSSNTFIQKESRLHYSWSFIERETMGEMI
jgi:F0F1-type ATP synthase assembly protein I